MLGSELIWGLINSLVCSFSWILYSILDVYKHKCLRQCRVVLFMNSFQSVRLLRSLRNLAMHNRLFYIYVSTCMFGQSSKHTPKVICVWLSPYNLLVHVVGFSEPAVQPERSAVPCVFPAAPNVYCWTQPCQAGALPGEAVHIGVVKVILSMIIHVYIYMHNILKSGLSIDFHASGTLWLLHEYCRYPTHHDNTCSNVIKNGVDVEDNDQLIWRLWEHSLQVKDFYDCIVMYIYLKTCRLVFLNGIPHSRPCKFVQH